LGFRPLLLPHRAATNAIIHLHHFVLPFTQRIYQALSKRSYGQSISSFARRSLLEPARRERNSRRYADRCSAFSPQANARASDSG